MEQRPIKIVRFDSAVYALETVKKAAYRYLDRFAPDIQMEGRFVLCQLSFSSSFSAEAIEEAVSEFQKEVLDQDLRQLVAAETTPYRNAILALAFSSSKLTQGE